MVHLTRWLLRTESLLNRCLMIIYQFCVPVSKVGLVNDLLFIKLFLSPSSLLFLKLLLIN